MLELFARQDNANAKVISSQDMLVLYDHQQSKVSRDHQERTQTLVSGNELLLEIIY